jgi:hypothetical protein
LRLIPIAASAALVNCIATIPGGAPFTTQAMQLTNAALAAIGINLNVTLNEDGSGSIAEGSYYPDVNTITDENGNCVTLQQVLPVTDDFTYQSMGNMMEYVGMAHPGINVLGIPGISSKAGQQLGGLQLASSLTFENFPMFPAHPTLCGADGNCFPFTTGDADGDGDIQVYPALNAWGFSEYIPGGYPLTGLTAGYFLKRGLNTDDLTSVYPGNTEPDFHLEWHGVDGVDSDLGWGDDRDVDEDNDGTWYDRQLGLPGITATYLNPGCGFTQPIFGDVSAFFPPECVTSVDLAASGLLMDPSGALANWGNFLTANAAQFSGCLAATGGDAGYCAATYPQWLVDDSAWDFNGVDGRLTMNFDIPCVPIIEAREVVAEFIEIGGACGSGDVNGDGSWNVVDIVTLVNYVLQGNATDCAADVNGDGNYNVLDVVALANCVLESNCSSGARINDATSVEFNVIGNEVTMTADGIVGGIQMTLSHGIDFSLNLTDDAQISEYLTDGNTTTVIIVNPTGNSLFTANGDFTIESVIASNYQGDHQLSTSMNNMLKGFSISSAYPNPFNPSTQMSLTLNTSADVSVKVFNMAGQLVDVIANGQMSSGTYSFAWDGTNVSSGVYFIQTEVGSEVQNQKIMLVK